MEKENNASDMEQDEEEGEAEAAAEEEAEMERRNFTLHLDKALSNPVSLYFFFCTILVCLCFSPLLLSFRAYHS